MKFIGGDRTGDRSLHRAVVHPDGGRGGRGGVSRLRAARCRDDDTGIRVIREDFGWKRKAKQVELLTKRDLFSRGGGCVCFLFFVNRWTGRRQLY